MGECPASGTLVYEERERGTLTLSTTTGSVYCVACQGSHPPPVAVAANDICPLALPVLRTQCCGIRYEHGAFTQAQPCHDCPEVNR